MREPDSAPRTASGETGVTAETTSRARRIWRLFWAIPRVGLWLSLTPVILASALWASFAIYFSNLPGHPLRTTAAWAFALGWLAAFLFLRGRLRILIAYGVAFGSVLLWWVLIPASDDRDWLANVARTPTAKVDGNILTVYNVRNFYSYAVEVPPEDEQEGRATDLRPFRQAVARGEIADLSSVFAIKYSERAPASAFLAVQYRGFWFYVDDQDFESKASFNALYDLWQLSVKAPTTQSQPVTTIRVN